MSKRKFIVQMIVEADDEMFDTAVMADAVEYATRDIDPRHIKRVAMRVSHSAGLAENPLAFMVWKSFIVQHEPLITVGHDYPWAQQERKWNRE